jgi:energy-coupling factor transporter ATP-binding protein EcfA2
MGSRKNYIETVKEICERIISKGYDNLKEEFKEVYINKRTADTEKHGNISVEERLLNFNENSKINSSDRIILNSVIEKIKKDKYEFSNTDKEDLVLFNKKIDFAIAQCQYITNIFDGENNYVKGHSLDIVTLFNDIKSSTTIHEFLKNTQIDNAFIKNPNFKSFLIYLFALVKNIESKNSYPIYYKYYQNIAKFFFNIELLDYDNFCIHFRETNFNNEPKLLEFNTYYYLLGENLKKELKLNGLSNENIDKRWLKKNLFNVDADSIDSVDVSLDSIENEFKKYLENNISKTSVNKYLGGISFVNRISLKKGLEELFTWDINDIDEKKEVLFNDEKFRKQNTTGNNMYSAVVNHYQKFLQFMEVKEDTMQFQIPPIKPFENFKWRWAVTTPSEGINSPEILIGVLQILYKHNGQKHAAQEFQDDLLELQTELGTRIDLAKVDRGLNKNIIENSGQYWKALGLLENSTGGIINLTRLGILIAEDNTNYDNFIRHLYSNFRLPNVHIESNEIIREWRDNNIEVSPIKLIFNILFEIKHQYKSPASCYITPEELKYIIIPLSVYSKLPLTQYVNEIFGYRGDTQLYESWPNCTPGDNDFRMVKEYLLFLSNFGYLDLIELKDKSKRYYLNAKSIKVLEKDYESIVDEIDVQIDSIKQISFDIKSFHTDCKSAGLVYTDKLVTRFVSSLATKPFVLLTGLSGSGKTKLAEAFAMWVCESEEQYTLIPVGADWTNREPLLGYPNALKDNEYVRPDNDALDLLMRAKEDENRPYFLVLDEMNLSHVERYFADFLSTMESKNSIPLHKMEEEVNDIPKKIKLPKNLFIVGTVNIDETTYMFSPKVLDRANTIEFRVSDTDISGFLENPKDVELEKLNGKGADMAKNFIEIATATKNGKKIAENYQLVDRQDVINSFFVELQKSGAEFGYRTAFEISKLIYKLNEFNLTEENDKLDIAIMQKMLPKLHGSRTKLSRTLKPLAKLCLKDVNDKFDKEYYENFENINFKEDKNIKYKLSFEKIMRMYKNAVENGFASYAEA